MTLENYQDLRMKALSLFESIERFTGPKSKLEEVMDEFETICREDGLAWSMVYGGSNQEKEIETKKLSKEISAYGVPEYIEQAFQRIKNTFTDATMKDGVAARATRDLLAHHSIIISGDCHDKDYGTIATLTDIYGGSNSVAIRIYDRRQEVGDEIIEIVTESEDAYYELARKLRQNFPNLSIDSIPEEEKDSDERLELHEPSIHY